MESFMDFLLQGFYEIGRNPSMIVMWIIGGLLIYLAIKKDLEKATSGKTTRGNSSRINNKKN